nr:WD repeat-containing protein 73 [Anas platyrhynchos]
MEAAGVVVRRRGGEEGGEEEEDDEDEEEDEWLLSSLRLYEDLHTFELQAPTRVIEWALGNRVCVAGTGAPTGTRSCSCCPRRRCRRRRPRACVQRETSRWNAVGFPAARCTA